MIVLLAVLLLVSHAAHGGPPPNVPTADMFAQQFSVTTGTTIPLNNGLDSITQAGMIHYDSEQQMLRMDHRFLDHHTSFIAHFKEGKVFLLTDGRCIEVSMNGTLLPFALPKESVLHHEGVMVRDTMVSHYEGVIRGIDEKLHRIDFFTKQLNRSEEAPTEGNWIPWRTTYSRSRRKELAPGQEPDDERNWRFYGESNKDEVAQYKSPSHAVVPYEPEMKVTTDYYNFHPYPPAPSLFHPPSTCKNTENEKTFDFSFYGTAGFGHQIFEFQKVLTDISLSTPRYQRLLEDACFRYFCDITEKESSRDAKPVMDDDKEG